LAAVVRPPRHRRKKNNTNKEKGGSNHPPRQKKRGRPFWVSHVLSAGQGKGGGKNGKTHRRPGPASLGQEKGGGRGSTARDSPISSVWEGKRGKPLCRQPNPPRIEGREGERKKRSPIQQSIQNLKRKEERGQIAINHWMSTIKEKGGEKQPLFLAKPAIGRKKGEKGEGGGRLWL